MSGKPAKRQRKLSSFFSQSTLRKNQDENALQQASVFQDENQSRFQVCIICKKSFPRHSLIQHASNCNGGDSHNVCANSMKNETCRYAQATTKSIFENESRFSLCPMCNKSVPYYDLNRHAQSCSGAILTNSTESDQSSLPLGPFKNSEHSSQQQEWQNMRKAENLKSTNVVDYDDYRNYKPGLTPSSEPLPGLFLFENFLTEDEETNIIRFLDSPPSSSSLPTGNKSSWKRATFNGNHFGQRWGVHCNLRDRRVYKEEAPLPQFMNDLILKLCELECMKGCIPNEANAIDYRRKAGHWLKSHVDDRQLSREAIANFSLAGDCLMTFCHEKKKKKQLSSTPNEQKVLLKRRTLQVLTGLARYDYSHGIRNSDLISERRISLTMRQSPLTTKI